MQRVTRKFRAWCGVAAATALALTMTACSGGQGTSSGDPAAGSGWSIPEQDPTAEISVLSILTVKQMKPVIDAFEKAHPTIKIKWQTVPFDALASTVDARVSNKGGDPDVYWADQPRISALAARGEVEDLTAAFSQYKDAFDPTAYDAGVYQDKLWALPIANSTQLLYYNKTLLDKAKLEHPSADPNQRMTWEDLTVDAKAAKDAGANYGFTFGQVDRYYQLEPLPVSKGGSAGGTGEGNLTPDIASQPWIDAFTWYGKLFADGVSPRGVSPDVSDPNFLAGKTAYMVQGPWLLPQLQGSKVDWGVAPHPQFAGGKAVTPTGSWSLGMNPFSKQKEATAIFMKWMAVDEGSGYIKYFPAPELAANVEGKKIYFQKEVFASEEGQKAAKIIDFETANTAVNRLPTVGYIEFEEILNRAFADIRNGSPAKTSLEAASKELETAWSKYR
ncbi:MAG: ABC transporter, substrate-binding protein (cluster 1, maltose/g3p/polyamine/iron) [uncultured Propionibacteriaceae bacterium]|uniref:ABC transporter, substrate-binding protein (Cluster 1, maltose/g3p/polyamine/iron) n=1 Tax=uncultured Propionibacteriaceae bacterium TaxID=257457 RepID=A0A6J4P0U8_9ACTN|nr:MAG: ABC transporter, substrate-binding protein (cluster 1, maltose/g3p/polyamine/iron) [uncultured Propionibacteriaceae bacterium]